jgi:leucine dehydrogenase
MELKVVKEVQGIPQSDEHTVFSNPSFVNHEQVVFCYDERSGLKAIIAIHNTVLGPALGGTRFWNYKSEAEALKDVLRLSRGMTFKAAISGLNLGGGKAVIFGDSRTDKSEPLFRRYGQFVDSLGGKYLTAEDVGTNVNDMVTVRKETRHVYGLPETMGGGGDPSPVTAYGVYMGMKAAAKQKWGSDSLSGKTIAVQGVGHVGEFLVEFLAKENAKVYISDVHEEQLKHVAQRFGSTIVSLDAIYDVDMDIYAPCALGGTVNTESLNRLKCSIIAGSANNQLANELDHGKMVMDKGIIYAPDFLINAGGLINVYSELHGYNRDNAMKATQKIYDLTLEILKKSATDNIPTIIAAKGIAEKRIKDALNAK